MIKRRMIPPVAALIVLCMAMLPIWLGVAAETAANQWTLTLLSAVFAFKTGLFWWMRRRMGGDSLTVFGMALRDFFLALTFSGVAMALFFGSFAWASWRMTPLARWEVVALRAALAASGMFVIATGFGAGWEMSRARTGPKMVVHVSPADVADDRVLYTGPNRRGAESGRRVTDR